MPNLRIDADKCIGCGKCVKMCLADNLEILDKKAHEKGSGCIGCGHCVSSCPKGAIELVGEGNEAPHKGWLDGSLVSDEELKELYTAMRAGSEGSRIWASVLQGERLDRYMDDALSILKEHASDLPAVGELERWREKNDVLEPNPVLWEGKQVLFIFSDSAERAFEASNRMIMRGFGMGIRGFHSNVLMLAYKEGPDKLGAYFPDAEGEMRMAFVIGHGRRLIEPLFKPIEKVKGLFRRGAPALSWAWSSSSPTLCRRPWPRTPCRDRP
ncbi:MAG: 4Fe-4S binding protein [Candidatus Methanomethylophilaceae archaeon]|nr:4Fe-4S binding protein [Candidatus Methanomethylophilaceae archaeon]